MRDKISQTNNFYYMTLSLIGLLILSSLVQSIPSSYGLLELVLQGGIIVSFSVCLLSLRFEPKAMKLLGIIILGFLITAFATNYFPGLMSDLLLLSWMLMFFVGMLRAMANQILFSGHVDMNKIIGSLALFLLLGLSWTCMYLMILECVPEAFSGVSTQEWGENFSHLAYFSFVTLTTLGYGDISPKTPFAEVVVFLEAIVGVFYMAIVVSSLVSSGLSNRQSSN